ncbi:sensor histidine kinase [Nonlabens xiamenensis]|uniref:sensor histidine kinase n=1 Tax=Nonlabens xiamenensis TaxID=2341043 RepID=UPI000F613F59|nr:ATP-binding protein [Nonlabens xiamenensis]
MTKGKYLSLLLLFVVGPVILAQTGSLDPIKELIDTKDFKQAKRLLHQQDTLKMASTTKARFQYLKALVLNGQGSDDITVFKQLLKAKNQVPKSEPELLFDINDELIYTYVSNIEDGNSPQRLVQENCNLARRLNDPIKLIKCDFYQLSMLDFGKEGDLNKGLALLRQSRSRAEKARLDETLMDIQANLSVFYDLAGQTDSALYFLDQVIPYYQNKKDSVIVKDMYLNKAKTLKNAGALDQAIQYYQLTLEDYGPLTDLTKKNMVLLDLADTYYLNGDYQQSAEIYQQKASLTDSLQDAATARSIEDLEAKYQTAQKESELLESEAELQRNRAQLFAVSGIALLLLLAAGMIYNNQRKKRQLAIKQRELEKQRADSILKNQELATIDAMISGQEKERKRLAEELHDNLGSSLTTVRLYFEELKKNVPTQQAQLVYDRAEQLLNDTYETIRQLSHRKNSGVLASQGLIPSIENLAGKISLGNKTEVKVLHHGLDKRLDNSLELLIFRSIQELLSNVIRHANASIVTISLTAHEKDINIMVEDNGDGFDPTYLPETSGMGLSNIEKRIEALEGSFEIDSDPRRGTTITIDIPII